MERVVHERPAIIKPNKREIGGRENVTFYARVSTDSNEQEESYERQREHFELYIRTKPEWNYVEGYADQGITGTKAEIRPEFTRMIEDCKAGKIDRILVKSVARFARNTVDTLNIVHELKDLGISVYFENEHIDTLTPNGEVALTMMAAMAEQESRTISTNIKWSYDKRFQAGLVLISANTLGYKKNPNGEGYVIVEEEAEVIRRIFREYVSGRSLRDIATDLNEKGYLTRQGNPFRPSSIQNILANEKYTGNSILGKTYKADVLSKRVKNVGQGKSYYVENSHPAIISQDIFEKAQLERKLRAELRSIEDTGKGRYSSAHAFSGLLVCGRCGAKFRRKFRKTATGKKVFEWVCLRHLEEHDECNMLPLKEEDIVKAYERVIKRVCGDLSRLVSIAKESITSVIKSENNEDLETIKNELSYHRDIVLDLYKKKIRNEIAKEEYQQQYSTECNLIKELEDKEKKTVENNTMIRLKIDRLDEMKNMIDKHDIINKEAMRRLLDHIVVLDKHRVEFQFKCGVNETEKI